MVYGNPYGGAEMEMANMGHQAGDFVTHGGDLVKHKVPVKTCWCATTKVDPMAQVHKAANLDIVVSLVP